MKKTINKNTLKLIMAILILAVSSSIIVKAQTDFVREEDRINKGCTADEWDLSFDGSNTSIYEVINNKKVYTKVDRAITSERRMAFTFYPESVSVRQGNLIKFITSGAVVPNNTMHAIYYYAGKTSEEAGKKGNYLLPVCPENLPSNSQTMDVGLIPPAKYFLDNTEVKRIPIGASEGGTISSNVVKLNRMELDTADMPPGFYWFTLQTTATVQTTNIMGGQFYSQQFAKTSPPVMIEVVNGTDNPPTVEITNIVKENCEQRIITANIEDKDNLPDSKIPAQNLTVTWKIDGQVVSTKLLGKNPKYTDSITTEKLSNGNHTVEVIVTDGKYTVPDSKTFTIDCIPEGKGAGIIYFQFAEPYKSETRRIYFNIEDYLNPESWVEFYSNSRGIQCKKEYPSTEFTPFYDYWRQYFDIPIPAMSRNTDKLDEIIRELKKNPNYNLDILGYADFKASYKYNVKLVDRRLAVVMRYLVDNGISENRLTSARVENKSNTQARSREKDNCKDSRRQDRRVELVYYTGVKRPELPSYAILYERQENEDSE
ncbi:hypothetical protein BH10ACI1_BH10ACI1_19990 [soil metagenome]